MYAPRIGVLIPCRNEEAVIERRLRNLAGLNWPVASGPHRVVVVDDGCSDRTTELAARLCRKLFDEHVQADVVGNSNRPGKPGAITQALAELEGTVELLCLSDADVVFEPEALGRVAAAFSRDPELALATGEQRFVASLAYDGTCQDQTGRAPTEAGGAYDRWTALVRRLESRRGALFSVHGQLLVWRAGDGLLPTPGIAADDLDLMLQARAAGGRVEQVAGARFLEVRAPAGAERQAQALRRARAFVQFLGHPRIRELSSQGDLFQRLQGAFYRTVPVSAPALALAVVVTSTLLAGWFFGAVGAAVAATWWLIAGLSPSGRRAIRLMRVISRAVRTEARGDMGDRWETARR